MSGVNKVIIVGNIGNKEIKEVGSGEVANISVATSEKWKDKDSGKDRENTEWHNIVLWNQLAKFTKDYLEKGDKVYVEGKLKTRDWEEDGKKRYKTEIIASQIQSMGSPKSSNQDEESGNKIPF